MLRKLCGKLALASLSQGLGVGGRSLPSQHFQERAMAIAVPYWADPAKDADLFVEAETLYREQNAADPPANIDWVPWLVEAESKKHLVLEIVASRPLKSVLIGLVRFYLGAQARMMWRAAPNIWP